MLVVSTIQKVLTAFVALSPLQGAKDLNVTLYGYGSFVGTTISKTLTVKPLPAAVDAWLGIDYALQPVGKRRFAQPAGFPVAFDGTRDASMYGPACIQGQEVPFLTVQDEACLSMNVYKTQGISMDQNLPVFIWIHGVSDSYPPK